MLGMVSLENLAAVKVAVEIYNDIELKKLLLDTRNEITLYGKSQWSWRVEREAAKILKNLNLPEKLKETVMAFILMIGSRMFLWLKYHKRTFEITFEDGLKFLNSSFLTSVGVIDDKKVAEALLDDKSLNYKQRYNLACVYCSTHHINASYSEATKDRFFFVHEPRIKGPLFMFWLNYLRGNRLRGKNIDLHRLESAVANGSRTAVEYCLEKTSVPEDGIVQAAMEAMRWMRVSRNIFDNDCYDRGKELWVPNYFYIDIVSFLFSKMREDQVIEFVKKDIRSEYSMEYFGDCTVLGCFLSWPHQNLFMKTAELVWGVLPERDYTALLLMICDKIEPSKGEWDYGEEKSFNYRGLLKEFWYKSPEPYKRYFLSNQIIYRNYGSHETTKSCSGFLIRLLSLKNFSYEDGHIIKTILAGAMENIVSSKEWIYFCFQLIEKERWEILDRFALNCFSSKEEAENFKRNLILTQRAKRIFFNFLTNKNWNAAESFLKWNFLSEERIDQLKKEMIDPKDVVELVCKKWDVEFAKKIFEWCSLSEEHVRQLKMKIIFSDVGILHFKGLILKNKSELADQYIDWFLFSQDKIKEFKKELAYRSNLIHEILTSYCPLEYAYDDRVGVSRMTYKFADGKWEIIEKFLTWCFSSEDDIIEFKKEKILKISGKAIHFHLILFNQWEEAERFFAWLGLSAEEIKELKKETLYDEAIVLFSSLIFNQSYEHEFFLYGSQQEAFELLLRWFLSDKETVLEFQNKFKSIHQPMNEEVFKTFDLAIAQRLSDLDEEKMG